MILHKLKNNPISAAMYKSHRNIAGPPIEFLDPVNNQIRSLVGTYRESHATHRSHIYVNKHIPKKNSNFIFMGRSEQDQSEVALKDRFIGIGVLSPMIDEASP